MQIPYIFLSAESVRVEVIKTTSLSFQGNESACLALPMRRQHLSPFLKQPLVLYFPVLNILRRWLPKQDTWVKVPHPTSIHLSQAPSLGPT